ncbi:MAG: hypothetical protein AAGE96_23855 [Cyanobacteria bacterium P01_G01_bin.19]
MLTGIELSRSDNYSNFGAGSTVTLDLFAPDYNNLIANLIGEPATEFFVDETVNKTLGIYLQDKMDESTC